MKMKLGVITILMLVSVNLCLVSASVGVGLSPSKMNLQVVGGEMQEIDLLVFNSGDNPMELKMVIEGDIAEFTTTDPESLSVNPGENFFACPGSDSSSELLDFFIMFSSTSAIITSSSAPLTGSDMAAQDPGRTGAPDC